MTLLNNPFSQDWIDFINSNAGATIFHHPAWLRLLVECYGYQPFVLGLRDENDKYRAGIPMMDIKSPITGRRWVSLPFSDFCSPLFENDSDHGQIIESLLSLAKVEHIHNVELRGAYSDNPALITESDYVFHELDLEPDNEKVFARMHEMHRRNIKTARLKGVQIVRGETSEHLREYYNLHLQTRRRQGVPTQPWKFFAALRKLFEQGLGFVLLAYDNQRCIAGAIFLHWQKTLTYKYGASLSDDLQVRPNNLIMWTAIQWGCNNGFNKLDLGRTTLSNEGLRAFKSRWGAREYCLPYTYLVPHAKKVYTGKLTALLSMLIRNSPPWFCRISGELLYKHFG